MKRSQKNHQVIITIEKIEIALIEEEELSDDIESQLTDSSETEVKVKRKPVFLYIYSLEESSN